MTPEEFKTLSNEDKDKEYEKLFAEHYAAEACIDGLTKEPDYSTKEKRNGTHG